MSKMKTVGGYAFLVLAILLLTASLISQIPSNNGWIRALDMVHEPALYVCVALAVAAALLDRKAAWWSVGGFFAAALVNIATLWPFIAIAPNQIALDENEGADCFTALSLNVYMDNRDYVRTARLIDREDPDILLLLEPDQAWADALAPQLARYETRVDEPLDNTYGLIFATRLPVDRAAISSEAGVLTPTLYASMRGKRGTPFDFVGLHPRPPGPNQDTEERDNAILRTDDATSKLSKDVVLMGDFNDVPWSHTMTALRERGEFQDPRVGRGTMPTFPADWVWLGWPLDHILVRNGVAVRDFTVLENVGADHLPLRAQLCLVSEEER